MIRACLAARLRRLLNGVSNSDTAEAHKQERAEDAALTKYKELYEYSTKILTDEHDRFRNADEKASKYTTILTFLIGIIAYLDKWTIDNSVPPRDVTDWIVLLIAVATLTSAVIAWFLVTGVVTASPYLGRPLNEEVLAFFRDNRLIDIYFSFAKSNAKAVQENAKKTAKKYRRLVIAFKWMYAAAVGVLLLIALFCWKSWEKKFEGDWRHPNLVFMSRQPHIPTYYENWSPYRTRSLSRPLICNRNL